MKGVATSLVLERPAYRPEPSARFATPCAPWRNGAAEFDWPRIQGSYPVDPGRKIFYCCARNQSFKIPFCNSPASGAGTIDHVFFVFFPSVASISREPPNLRRSPGIFAARAALERDV